MKPKGFLREGADGVLLVGAEDKAIDYSGPVAEVYTERGWLFIVTDSYEGCAMLNLEALPHLRRALSKLAKRGTDRETAPENKGRK